ncbi:MAG: peptidoglycan-associated lipoprotein Pal [Candidatus Zixiibacteriota bacterium]|nr:MAG: peptidoglycan-associated lipoprotein Pal [candidate division Zixibacteria bacterium]
MKNLLTLLAIAALIALMVVGCAKKPKVEAPTQPTTTETKPPVTTSDQSTDQGKVESEPSSKFRAIYFDFDRYNLRDDTKADLRKNIDVMMQDQNIRITVEGHCDERGTVEYNLALGERRAKSARDYMVSMGVKADRISTISYGKERPAEFGHDEGAWAKNRRDEFVEK